MDIKLNDIIKLEIYDQDNDGFGIGKYNNMVVFVKNALPGETGDVIITELKKNYAKGEMQKFDKISSNRCDAPCSYFNECGGCNLQHQRYTEQLLYKENKIKKALSSIAKINDVKINKMESKAEYYYRNKVTLKVDKNIIGYYKNKSNSLISINECLLCNEKINSTIMIIKEYIKDFPNHNITEIVIRYSSYKDEIMIVLNSPEDKNIDHLIDYLKLKLINLKTIILNDKTVYGDGFIMEKVGDFEYKISSSSFFQINSREVKNLYDKVLEYAAIKSSDTILDLYCGAGTISLMIAKYAKKVIGVEVVESAIKDANENASLNNIVNTSFVLGKVEDCIGEIEDKAFDIVVLDPPRFGSDIKTLESIINLNPRTIVYISCDPGTLSRDLITLAKNYFIEEITPIDMFPETSHLECIVKLVRK